MARPRLGWGVRAMNLRNGALSLAEFDATFNDQPRKAAVSRLVVTPGGSYAWTWTIDYRDHVEQELRKVEPGGKRGPGRLGVIVDSGPDLDLTSLERDGSDITWLHGGVEQSETLE